MISQIFVAEFGMLNSAFDQSASYQITFHPIWSAYYELNDIKNEVKTNRTGIILALYRIALIERFDFWTNAYVQLIRFIF